ncbi:DUF4256 domain-containing protein [Aerococcus sp. UMB7834]|uniref:DUF4256 domain-containing protein n=1 Tax=Aerococcus sp. UMB7834 TaxID=3046342 RepID=UPI00254D70F5|nr:DUF4256 domain-containing protein [Aerococcus sp. UMB7834]MDK6805448.1 DUF4256 domain-containing protein [Aerococcus sp. UMB7834]
MDLNERLKPVAERFEAHPDRHPDWTWEDVLACLAGREDLVESLLAMEETGGEPDLIASEPFRRAFFADMSLETPAGRRSLCYDREARLGRKKFPPETSVEEMCQAMGTRLMPIDMYLTLHLLENLDSKTSSWLKTPAAVRELGGAVFGDYRYGQAFIYHNGADAYYKSRGFRSFIYLPD